MKLCHTNYFVDICLVYYSFTAPPNHLSCPPVYAVESLYEKDEILDFKFHWLRRFYTKTNRQVSWRACHYFQDDVSYRVLIT